VTSPVPVTAAPAATDAPPVARTVDLVEKPFGVEVSDPYRWMEGDDNAEFRTWLLAQNDYARKQLSRLPARDKLYERLRALEHRMA
jgi:prolyl oligopeptidase